MCLQQVWDSKCWYKKSSIVDITGSPNERAQLDVPLFGIGNPLDYGLTVIYSFRNFNLKCRVQMKNAIAYTSLLRNLKTWKV